ncbi:hypothetical protein BH11ARM2_BH11ARM2_37590 [soil metagenome]
MERRRKKRTGETAPLSAERPNRVWRVGFVFDGCLDGTKLKIPAVKGGFAKERLSLEARTRFRSGDVRRTLEACFAECGAPDRLRSDNGGGSIARTLAAFLSRSGTGARFIEPGSPWQNGFIETFNPRLRAECLDVEVFYNLADAQIKLAVHRRRHNEERPRSSIENAAPAVFRARYSDSGRAVPSLHPNSAMTQTTGETLVKLSS